MTYKRPQTRGHLSLVQDDARIDTIDTNVITAEKQWRGFGGRWIKMYLDQTGVGDSFIDTGIETIDLQGLAEGAQILTVTPHDPEEVIHLLANGNHRVPGTAVQLISITDQMAALDEVNVEGPRDGRPMIIDLRVGSGSMRINGGYVIVRLLSPAPYEITVGEASDVTVIVGRGRAGTVIVEGDSDVTVVAETGARAMVQMKNADANLQQLGDVHGIKVANIAAWGYDYTPVSVNS